MTRNDFWNLIGETIKRTQGSRRRFTAALDKRLASLPARECEEFARHFADLQNEANTPGILEAAWIIGCGQSNDGFIDFRKWIVFQGEAEYKTIVADPDYLGSYMPAADPIEDWYCEYYPQWARGRSAENELERFSVAAYPCADTDIDKPDVLAKRYPKLWMRIHDKVDEQQQLSDLGQSMFTGATLGRIDDCNGVARFVFSSGAEIHIRDYWNYYKRRYGITGQTPQYDNHPLLGQVVDSIDASFFPASFHMWFENRRKLSLGRDISDCRDFDVFNRGALIRS